MSESTVTTPVTTRLKNRDAAELRLLASARGQSVSSVIAAAVAAKLPELRQVA
jgi:hypothetical protein